MEVSLEMVRNVFEDLIAGRTTRSAAGKWAYNVDREIELGHMVYTPASEIARISYGISFIQVYEETIAPDTYLYHENDLKQVLKNDLSD